MDAVIGLEHTGTLPMLTGAIVMTLGFLAFRLGLRTFDYEAKILTRKGIDPDSMPDRRVALFSSRAAMWFFGVLAVILWIGGLIGLLVT